MRKYKRFLEGCLEFADGIERASDAINGLRRAGAPAQSQRQDFRQSQDVIDIASAQAPPPGAPPSYGLPEQFRAPPQGAAPTVVTHHEVRTIEQRVAYIVAMVQKGRDDGRVREFAVKAISQRCGDRWCTPENDNWAEVQALYRTCQEYYRYCGDTLGKDLFQHPAKTLEFGGGDCDDATILICSTLGAVGYETKCRVIRTKTSRDWNHIYALVGLPQKSPSRWVPLDMSVSDKPPGWEPPRNLIAAIKDFAIPVGKAP